MFNSIIYYLSIIHGDVHQVSGRFGGNGGAGGGGE